MEATISSSGTINTLGTPVPSCAGLGPGIPACPSSGLSLEENHHSANEGEMPSTSLEPGIIIPASSLLPDTTLIIPEKVHGHQLPSVFLSQVAPIYMFLS